MDVKKLFDYALKTLSIGKILELKIYKYLTYYTKLFFFVQKL